MFTRMITFYCTDQEIEQALPRLTKAQINFSVLYIDSQKKEAYAVTCEFSEKDKVARILYG